MPHVMSIVCHVSI